MRSEAERRREEERREGEEGMEVREQELGGRPSLSASPSRRGQLLPTSAQSALTVFWPQVANWAMGQPGSPPPLYLLFSLSFTLQTFSLTLTLSFTPSVLPSLSLLPFTFVSFFVCLHLPLPCSHMLHLPTLHSFDSSPYTCKVRHCVVVRTFWKFFALAFLSMSMWQTHCSHKALACWSASS